MVVYLQDARDFIEDDPTGNKAIWDRGLLNGASQKLDMLCMFHIGEAVSYLDLATLIPGGLFVCSPPHLARSVSIFMKMTCSL